MTALSDALADFYERKGGRIFFQNGMSLNQLALEMWERLGYQQIDPSVISRVLSGERLFTPQQLKIFVAIIGVPNYKRKLLYRQLLKDVASRFGEEIDEGQINPWRFSPKMINLLTSSTNLIEIIRLTGMPEVVQNLTDMMIELSEEIEKNNNLPKAKKYQISRTRGLLLYEKIHSLTDTCLGSELVTKISLPLQKLTTISNNLEDDDLKGRLNLLKTTAYGVLGSYSQKYRKFHLAGKIFSEKGLVRKVSDPTVEMKLVGRLIESAGYLQDENYIKRQGEHKVFSLLESNGNQYPTQACILISDLALAKSYIGDENTFSLIERGWKIYQKEIINQPRLEAHLIRSTLEIMVNSKSHDLNFATKLIKRMETLSLFGFKRHWFYSQKYYKILVPSHCKTRKVLHLSP